MDYLTGGILLVVGLIACFFGWRFYRMVLALSGFVAGYYAAAGALVDQSDAVQIVGAILAGVIVGFIFWTFYKFAYVLFGAVLGLTAAALIGQAFNLEGSVTLILALVLLVIGGLLGLMLADFMIRLGTSFGGATQAIAGVAALAAAASVSLPLVDPRHSGASADSTEGIITMVAVFVLAVVGFMYQSQHDPEAA